MPHHASLFLLSCPLRRLNFTLAGADVFHEQCASALSLAGAQGARIERNKEQKEGRNKRQYDRKTCHLVFFGSIRIQRTKHVQTTNTLDKLYRPGDEVVGMAINPIPLNGLFGNQTLQ